jgi:hypothetical protein
MARREANAPRTRLVIAELLDYQRERLNELFDQTLNITQDAFQGRKIFLVRGVLLDRGPDHYARIEAAKLFIRMISSGGDNVVPPARPRTRRPVFARPTRAAIAAGDGWFVVADPVGGQAGRAQVAESIIYSGSYYMEGVARGS